MNDLRDCIKQYCIDAIHTPSVIITSDAMLNMQLLNVLYEYQLRIQRMYKLPRLIHLFSLKMQHHLKQA